MTVFPQGTLIWQRFTNVSCLRTYYGKKRRVLFDPQRENLLVEDTIYMVNLLGTPRVIFFFYYMIDVVWLLQKRSFVLSRELDNQNVATIGTLLDQFMLRCKEERFAHFSQCLPRT